MAKGPPRRTCKAHALAFASAQKVHEIGCSWYILQFKALTLRSVIPFWGSDASVWSFAIACYVSSACADAGRFYDWVSCDIGCRSSGCGALRGAESAKQDACKRSRRDCTKNAPDPASPLDHQLYRQRASVCVPQPPLQHIEHLRDPCFFIAFFCLFFFLLILFAFYKQIYQHYNCTRIIIPLYNMDFFSLNLFHLFFMRTLPSIAMHIVILATSHYWTLCRILCSVCKFDDLRMMIRFGQCTREKHCSTIHSV